MKRSGSDTHQKALEINLDHTKYGTFAEIGAGQEVARWFFRAGGAAGTIAKSMSAYDMVVSDSIYGAADRYVSRRRLQTMLDYEFQLLQERLRERRGANTRFFVFADTVKARSYKSLDESHGWMGVRFQSHPLSEPSQIIIHVRMLDRENLQQQEALGIVGVNLIHAALYSFDQPEWIIGSLLDNLDTERIEVDMIKFSGPAFEDVDNRLMSLQLVEQGLSRAAMFTTDGEVIQPGEVLYKKPILVERGRFRPVTNVTADMLESALSQFSRESAVQGEEIVVLMEMNMSQLKTEEGISHKDFLERVDILGTLGKTVLISNYLEYYRLAGFLFRYTKQMIGIVMGMPSLAEIFEEKYYTDLEGGILEAFGRLFKNALRLYVYPALDPIAKQVVTADDLKVAPHLKHLYLYLKENGFIEGIRNYNPNYLPISARDVLAKIQTTDPSWETMVPPQVARIIKSRQLLGFSSVVKDGEAAPSR